MTRRMFLAAGSAAVAAGVCAPRAAAARAPSQWGMALPGIATSFVPAGRQLALTFDACPGRGCDDALLDTLRHNQVPAVLFLNARWIDQHPDRAAELAADPLFEIGNHGTRHVPLSVSGRSAYGIPGTRSPAEVVDEVSGDKQKITELTGRPPTWFRPGTAHYDDVAVSIVHDLGERPLGFTVNADAGATLPAAKVCANVLGAAPGSILISHMNHPEAGTAAGYAAAIPQLRAAGWEFVPLRDRVVQ
ncbi:polysaccharide deacetylase [Mycolicibacterium canariasense]|uniref:Polysaccharide deacetylase n=1 Tax=Mycolicibacterium canariasense TaxID=228230 RepID=A0A100WGB3_MYCCR|nr:polysaccharide deacetylase family protein [Mycolicibacterium canariasense]GAS97722.1 polysaccharide deacetylase [Mycolicibacterium canariasense]